MGILHVFPRVILIVGPPGSIGPTICTLTTITHMCGSTGANKPPTTNLEPFIVRFLEGGGHETNVVFNVRKCRGSGDWNTRVWPGGFTLI